MSGMPPLPSRPHFHASCISKSVVRLVAVVFDDGREVVKAEEFLKDPGDVGSRRIRRATAGTESRICIGWRALRRMRCA